MTGPRSQRDAADHERAAARRAFIRAQHPDAGGDPERFMAGLAAFDGRSMGTPTSSSAHSSARPTVHRSRRPDRLVRLVVRDLRRRIAGRPPRNLQ